MKIIEFKATTGYSGLLVPIRGTYPQESESNAYRVLTERAFAIYKAKVEADPERLSKYEMRFCIWEKEPDENGLFRVVRTIFRDFLLVDGVVTLIKEQTFNK